MGMTISRFNASNRLSSIVLILESIQQIHYSILTALRGKIDCSPILRRIGSGKLATVCGALSVLSGALHEALGASLPLH